MSFSSQTKDELTKKRVKTDVDRLALILGVISAIGTISLRRGKGVGVKFTTESDSVAKLIARTATAIYDVETELAFTESNSGINSHTTALYINGTDAEKLMRDAGMLSSDGGETILDTVKASAMRTYLRGVFLACGSVNDPNNSYHLEMVCRSESFAGEIRNCIASEGISAMYFIRKEQHIVYIKGSEMISDFLTAIGASSSTLEVQSVRAYRDTRNYANRTRNCDLANISKTMCAAERQVAAIRKLYRYKVNLPAPLRIMAEVRINNETATLSELAQILGIGKSGVNHRLAKLVELADSLGDD